MTNANAEDALDANDIAALRSLVLENPLLLSASLRERVWPLFVPQPSIIAPGPIPLAPPFVTHRDYQQVLKDVNRSFVDVDDNLLLKERLLYVIMTTLWLLPDLYYYQGYHDVASVVVSVVHQDDEAVRLLCSLSVRYLRDHCLKDMDESLLHLQLIPQIIRVVDPKFHAFIAVENPVYSLSAILSLFSHDLQHNALIQVWDFILAHDDPSLVIYIYAAMVLYFKDDILNELRENGTDRDMVLFTLSKLIHANLNSSIDIEMEIKSTLSLALKLREIVKLNKLPSFKCLNKCSVLRITTSSVTILKLQSLKSSQSLAINYYALSKRIFKVSSLVLILSLLYKSLKN